MAGAVCRHHGNRARGVSLVGTQSGNAAARAVILYVTKNPNAIRTSLPNSRLRIQVLMRQMRGKVGTV